MSVGNRIDEKMERLKARFGERRIVALSLLAIAALASIVIILLVRLDMDNSALLYLAVPYGVAVLITLVRPFREYQTWWERYISHSVSALVVFLASSVILFEGFICVLFFVPIYFFVVALAFVAHGIAVTWRDRRGKNYASVIPLLVLLLSVEGTNERVTFDRDSRATATVTTTLSPEELLDNLARPFELPASGDWMLGVFPMPTRIEAGSLEPGDVHRAHFLYRRWFVTNTHEGEIGLRIDSVSAERVTATYVENTSYIANYVDLLGAEITMEAAGGGTIVTVAIEYERRLDPAWYFHPIQQYAVGAMAEHFIEQVMLREE